MTTKTDNIAVSLFKFVALFKTKKPEISNVLIFLCYDIKLTP